jgi:hypothetical protein
VEKQAVKYLERLHEPMKKMMKADIKPKNPLTGSRGRV